MQEIRSFLLWQQGREKVLSVERVVCREGCLQRGLSVERVVCRALMRKTD